MFGTDKICYLLGNFYLEEVQCLNGVKFSEATKNNNRETTSDFERRDRGIVDFIAGAVS